MKSVRCISTEILTFLLLRKARLQVNGRRRAMSYGSSEPRTMRLVSMFASCSMVWCTPNYILSVEIVCIFTTSIFHRRVVDSQIRSEGNMRRQERKLAHMRREILDPNTRVRFARLMASSVKCDFSLRYLTGIEKNHVRNMLQKGLRSTSSIKTNHTALNVWPRARAWSRASGTW